MSRKRNELVSIEQRIVPLSMTEPVVSEHALLRYIERVMGLDLDAIRQQILNDKNRAAIAFAGNCRIKSGGVELIVKDRTVVSVV